MQSDNQHHITALLNASSASIHELISIETDKPNLMNTPIIQTDHGVLIGIVGDIKGRIFILGTETMFAKAELAMYGGGSHGRHFGIVCRRVWKFGGRACGDEVI